MCNSAPAKVWHRERVNTYCPLLEQLIGLDQESSGHFVPVPVQEEVALTGPRPVPEEGRGQVYRAAVAEVHCLEEDASVVVVAVVGLADMIVVAVAALAGMIEAERTALTVEDHLVVVE